MEDRDPTARPLVEDEEDRRKLEREELALWEALETDKRAPAPEHLRVLSGILGEDITRAENAWQGLATETRRELVHALGRAAGEDFKLDFSAIFRIAIDDPDGEIRAAGVAGLDDIDDARLVPRFVELLRDDVSATARAAAADGLAKYVLLGELEKIRPAPFNAAVVALRECYLDASETPEIRNKALRAIAYTEEHGVPDLIKAAYEDGDEQGRISAVLAMGRNANATWAGTVKRELSSPIPDMRLEATRACGELQLADVVDDIVVLADDVDQRIRFAALWALGQIGGVVARQALTEYTSSEDDDISTAAEEALQELDFFSGDLTEFFSPAGGTDEEAEALWHLPGYINQDDDE